jgi:hypothetical protein
MFLFASSAQANTLDATITEDVNVMDLKPGMTWSENFVKKIPQRDIWFPIPMWLAGKWSSKTATQLSNSGFQTFRNVGNECYGQQTDRDGRIWAGGVFPAPGRSDSGNFVDLSLSIVMEPISTNPEKFVLHTAGTSIIYEKFSGRIVRTIPYDDIQTFIPSPPDSVFKDTVDSTNGAHYQQVLTRLAFYKPVPAVRESFAKHLHSLDRDDLLPP